uniref:ATP-binding cassette domain-containing protein n=1 Tax=Clostridium sp. NkU-1 TaxID=1095009 RepID=UPI00326111F8
MRVIYSGRQHYHGNSRPFLPKQKTGQRGALRLLPEEALSRPVSTLSGGMKRRVAIVRALSVPCGMVLMDEPFTGLDENTKRTVIQYIKEKNP